MLNPTEAIQGFLNFLGTDTNTIYRLGDAQNSSTETERIQRQLDVFCKANSLPTLSPEWENKVVYPLLVD